MDEIEKYRAMTVRYGVGPTILLGSGEYYDLLHPAQSAITIEDIAFGLAYTCRFAGQTYSPLLKKRVFYSVAEHCVRGSYKAEEIGRPDLALPFLMHETGEAVCGDMTAPLKVLCPEYKVVEERCHIANAAKFGITFDDPVTLKELDVRMLFTERRDLTLWQGETWGEDATVEPFPDPIYPWEPDAAAAAFLARYNQLVGGR